MATNPYKNKIVYNGTTLIDLTGDDVTASDVASGVHFHLPSGAPSVGTATIGGVIIEDIPDSHGGTIKNITTTNSITIGQKTITENGTYDPSDDNYDGYSLVTVSVSGGGSPTLETKSVTPTESSQTVTPDTGYDGLSSVSVGAISSTYVGSGIDRNDSTDLTVSGATVTVPAGYYESQASKAVSNGSATTPATTITVNPSISVSNSGLITATASATQSVTPTVSAGYVSSGTAGTITVSGSNTEQLTTKGATTYTPTTTSQTIASGTYLTGTQTISGDANLVAGNIKKDVSIFGVTGSFEGGGTSMNTQTTQSTSRRNNTALGSIMSLTCSKAGKYDVYWTCARSNTSQTWGSQLYINGSAYGTENTTWSNNVQNNHLTGVTIGANQTVAVYGRSRSGYYIYAPQLTIVQTA